jgi:hypothetical protein
VLHDGDGRSLGRPAVTIVSGYDMQTREKAADPG